MRAQRTAGSGLGRCEVKVGVSAWGDGAPLFLGGEQGWWGGQVGEGQPTLQGQAGGWPCLTLLLLAPPPR